MVQPPGRPSRPSRSDVPPMRRSRGVSAGQVPSRPARSILRSVLAIAAAIGLISVACPRDRPTIPSNILGEHPGMVLATVVSPDGRWLASSGLEGSIRVWDAENRSLEQTLEVELGPAHTLAWSPDGRTLAAGDVHGVVSLWDARSWERLRTISRADLVRSVAWSPDGSLLAAGGSDANITIWDTASWRPRPLLRGHSTAVNLLAFSADGRTLISAGADGMVGTWDVAASRSIRFVRAGPLPLSGLAITPDGDILAACHFGPGVFRCRLNEADGETRSLQEGGPYLALAGSADGRLLAASTSFGTIDLWDLPERRRIVILKGHSGPVRGMAFSPDRRTFFSGGLDGTIRIWRARGDGDVDGPMVWLPVPAQDASATASASPP